jgi:hypothetical protein
MREIRGSTPRARDAADAALDVRPDGALTAFIAALLQ